MNDPYREAKLRLAQLREEERILNEFILAHDRALRVLRPPRPTSLFEDAAEPPERPPSPMPETPEDGEEPLAANPPEAAIHRRARVTDNPKPTVVVEAAIGILREHGRPMSRRDLHKALAKQGLVVRGANPIKALGTMLWRGRGKLVQIEGHGYWPIADSYHPAGYYPAL